MMKYILWELKANDNIKVPFILKTLPVIVTGLSFY